MFQTTPVLAANAQLAQPSSQQEAGQRGQRLLSTAL